MRTLKFVAPRLAGAMGNATIKTHLVLHIADDILNFGVPEVMNSSYAESAHITISKDTTRNTQKRQETFTVQAAMRYVENLAIRKSVSSVSDSSPSTNLPPTTHRLQGKRYSMERDAHGNVKCRRFASKKKVDDSIPEEYHLNSHVTNTLASYCLPHLTTSILHCHTEYKSADGQIYRAHPNYHQKPWFDYALVKCGSRISFPHSGQSVAVKTPGFYAVIESYNEVVLDNDDDSSDVEDLDVEEVNDHNNVEEEVDRSIFREFKLSLIPGTLQPILYLVHVNAIWRPTVAIPDTFSDSPPDNNAQSLPDIKYLFMILSPSEWSTTWDSFIHKKHREVVITREKPESDESGDEGFVQRRQIVAPAPVKSKRRKPRVRNSGVIGRGREARIAKSPQTKT
ncbi:hypothetical protein MHU86_17017 [Fragilaria crotonensis]|nr:hypothetical protein MHU86_17017 [Fragilaria crotonensis]